MTTRTEPRPATDITYHRVGTDGPHPIWEVRLAGTRIGTCWRRAEGRPGYYGAWAYRGRGRTRWTDSRKDCGARLLKLAGATRAHQHAMGYHMPGDGCA